MATSVRKPREPSPLDDLVTAVNLLSQRASASDESPSDNQQPAFQNNSSREGVPARPVSPHEDIAAIFDEKESPASNKHPRQHLSDDAKVNKAYTVLECLRALQKIVRAAIAALDNYLGSIARGG